MATSPLIRATKPEALELHVVREGQIDPNQFTIENGVNGHLEDFDREYFSVSGYFGTFNPQIFCAAPDLLNALQRLHHNFNLLLAGKPVRDVAETEAEVNAAILKATRASNG